MKPTPPTTGPTPTKIDELVVAKLRKLGLVPSDVSSDEEFLRRASLDATGTLPLPDEATAFLAAGIRVAQVIGASDEHGMGPAADPITPDQVAASFYHALGIDYEREYYTNTGRPVMIVREGSLIPGLVG